MKRNFILILLFSFFLVLSGCGREESGGTLPSAQKVQTGEAAEDQDERSGEEPQDLEEPGEDSRESAEDLESFEKFSPVYEIVFDIDQAVEITGLGDCYVSCDIGDKTLYYAGDISYCCPKLAGEKAETFARWEEDGSSLSVSLIVDDGNPDKGAISGGDIWFTLDLSRGVVTERQDIAGTIEPPELSDGELLSMGKILTQLMTEAAAYYEDNYPAGPDEEGEAFGETGDSAGERIQGTWNGGQPAELGGGVYLELCLYPNGEASYVISRDYVIAEYAGSWEFMESGNDVRPYQVSLDLTMTYGVEDNNMYGEYGAGTLWEEIHGTWDAFLEEDTLRLVYLVGDPLLDGHGYEGSEITFYQFS